VFILLPLLKVKLRKRPMREETIPGQSNINVYEISVSPLCISPSLAYKVGLSWIKVSCFESQ
jgi:hypothetical protein